MIAMIDFSLTPFTNRFELQEWIRCGRPIHTLVWLKPTQKVLAVNNCYILLPIQSNFVVCGLFSRLRKMHPVPTFRDRPRNPLLLNWKLPVYALLSLNSNLLNDTDTPFSEFVGFHHSQYWTLEQGAAYQQIPP